MMTLRRLGAIALLGLLASAQAHAADPKTKLIEDLVYTKVGDRELKLDLIMPADGDGPFPALFVIHGGGWAAGNKKDVRFVMEEAAKRGYVAISPQYRFCPQDIFPAQVHDVKNAVRWAKTHAKEYKINPDKLGATGFSAGGHLSLMLGGTGPDDGLEGDAPAGSPSTQIQAVVNYFGPTDFAATDLPEVTKPIISKFFGGSAQEKPDVAKKASPITYVTKGDAPTLTFQGTKDPLVPHTQATKLADAMTAAGVPGRVELLVGASHGWGGPEMKHTIDETFAFFDRYLK